MLGGAVFSVGYSEVDRLSQRINTACFRLTKRFSLLMNERIATKAASSGARRKGGSDTCSHPWRA